MSTFDWFNRATYRIFVLVDPRDPTDEDMPRGEGQLADQPRLPRWVGYGPSPAPWDDLWDFRRHGSGALFEWFRDLDANGLEPMVSRHLRWRLSIPIDYKAARAISRDWIWWICHFYGPAPGEFYFPEYPPFLLNPRLGPPGVRKPIVAERPDGEMLPFDSVGHAMEHGFTRSAIYKALKNGTKYKELTWRYVSNGGPCKRPVEKVTSCGEVVSFPSVYQASKATGVSRQRIMRLVESAETDASGCRWRDAGR